MRDLRENAAIFKFDGDGGEIFSKDIIKILRELEQIWKVGKNPNL